MVIWKDVPVKLIRKFPHIRWMGDRLRNSFAKDFGDVPVCHLNKITGQIETVDNPRGNAYATRNRLKWRKTKKEKLYTERCPER